MDNRSPRTPPSQGARLASPLHLQLAGLTSGAAGGKSKSTRFVKSHGVFWMTCRVEIGISASAQVVWSLLTNAENFSRWNSTVSEIEGQIQEGERLRIHVPGTDRTFTPRVSDVVPNARMTWIGGLAPIFTGARFFVVRPSLDGMTYFCMEERFSGILTPLVRRLMPDFGPIFERYADDLKREAERVAVAARAGL